MACPKCGCKVTYPACNPLEFYEDDEMERCSNCGYTFWIEEAEDEDDDCFDDNENFCDIISEE